ncbi:MAG: hypothetical protein AB1758_27240, partial [Candidatus Eremiobacterota bacterium]
MIINQYRDNSSYQVGRASGPQQGFVPTQTDGFTPAQKPDLGDWMGRATALSTTASALVYMLGSPEIAGVLGLPLVVSLPIAAGSTVLQAVKGGGLRAFEHKSTIDKLGRAAAVSGVLTAVAAMAGAGDGVLTLVGLPMLGTSIAATALMAHQWFKNRKNPQPPTGFQPPPQAPPTA